jgi:hypothetical protein
VLKSGYVPVIVRGCPEAIQDRVGIKGGETNITGPMVEILDRCGIAEFDQIPLI